MKSLMGQPFDSKRAQAERAQSLFDELVNSEFVVMQPEEGPLRVGEPPLASLYGWAPDLPKAYIISGDEKRVKTKFEKGERCIVPSVPRPRCQGRTTAPR